MNHVTPEKVGISSERLDRIRPVMQNYIDDKVIAGAITLVARQGQVAYLECHGLMDVEANKPMQPDTIFRIYSMTKPITCVAMMMLLEEGRFQLFDPVAKYIPEFADLMVLVDRSEKGIVVTDLEHEMTIRDLFTHTAGLGYGLYDDSPIEDLYRESGINIPFKGFQVSLSDLPRALSRLPLAHQPGTVWRYSMAHDVLGYLIALLSDMPFDTFLEERVFRPLGMADTGFCLPEAKIPRLAALYGAGEDHRLNLLDEPSNSRWLNPEQMPSGGGGLVSTTSDYLRFAQMLINGGELDGQRLLGRKTVELMTMNHLPSHLMPIWMGANPIRGLGYGLGFGVVMDPAQNGLLGSKGVFRWGGAAATRFWVDPKESLIGLLMLQYLGLEAPVRQSFRNLVYQAIVD